MADTNKALLSVSRLVAAGNTMVFSPEGSFIRDGSGETIWLNEAAGMYTVKLWVAADQKKGQVAAEGF